MIEVVPVGARVRVGYDDDPIHGEITGILIQSDHYVTYEVTWWDGRSRHAEWFTRGEFSVYGTDGHTNTRIGFNG